MGRIFKVLIAEHKMTKKEKETGKINYLLRSKYYWEELCHRWHNLVNPIYVFKESITTTLKWLPVIWKDRQWDHTYIWLILKFKLSLVANELENNSHHIGAELDAAKVKQAMYLISRIQADDYCADKLEAWHQVAGSFDFNNVDENNCLKRTIERTEAEAKVDNANFKKIIAEASYLKNQDYDTLFKLLKKNLERWWS
jgi:hypothetical protein